MPWSRMALILALLLTGCRQYSHVRLEATATVVRPVPVTVSCKLQLEGLEHAKIP